METYDTNRIITCQLILKEVLADVESSAKASIQLAIDHLENALSISTDNGPTEVGQQCINCGHTETGKGYSCSKCGSTDLHLFPLIDKDLEYRNAVAVETYRMRRNGWGQD